MSEFSKLPFNNETKKNLESIKSVVNLESFVINESGRKIIKVISSFEERAYSKPPTVVFSLETGDEKDQRSAERFADMIVFSMEVIDNEIVEIEEKSDMGDSLGSKFVDPDSKKYKLATIKLEDFRGLLLGFLTELKPFVESNPDHFVKEETAEYLEKLGFLSLENKTFFEELEEEFEKSLIEAKKYEGKITAVTNFSLPNYYNPETIGNIALRDGEIGTSIDYLSQEIDFYENLFGGKSLQLSIEDQNIVNNLTTTYLSELKNILSILENRVNDIVNESIGDMSSHALYTSLKLEVDAIKTYSGYSEIDDHIDDIEIGVVDLKTHLSTSSADSRIVEAIDNTIILEASNKISDLEKQRELLFYFDEIKDIDDFLENELPPQDKQDLSGLVDYFSSADLSSLKTSLESLDTGLKALWDGKFGPGAPLEGYINNDDVGYSNLTKKRDEFNKILNLLIKESEQTESGFIEEMEAGWSEMMRNEGGSKGHTNQKIMSTISSNTNSVALLRELDNRSQDATDFKTEWGLKIPIIDGWTVGAKTDIFKQLAWSVADESRAEVGKHVGVKELREFIKLSYIRPVIERIEEIFTSGPFVFTDSSGAPLDHPDTGDPMPTHDSDGELISHNFGQSGNPSDISLENGEKLNMGQILSMEFPNLESSSIDAVKMIAMIGELRCKAYMPYYESYSESPKSTFDVSPIMSVAPMAYILYKIRSIQLLPPGYRTLWQIMRLPSDYNDEGSKSNLLDSKTKETERDVVKNLKDSKGNGVKDSKGNWVGGRVNNGNNVKDAIRIRRSVDSLITDQKTEIPLGDSLGGSPQSRSIPKKAGFYSVELPESGQIMPFIWDLITDDLGDNYGGITYKEYADAISAWNKFREFVEKPPTIQSEGDVQTAVGQIISKLSPVKGIEAPLRESKEYHPILIQLIQQMFLRYLKNIYDQYEMNIKLPGQVLRNIRFTQLCKKGFAESATLIKEVNPFIVDAVEEIGSLKLTLDPRKLKIRRMFMDILGWPELNMGDFSLALAPPKLAKRFDTDLQRYMRKPTIEEMEQGDGE